jgi:general secretion pathway protein C
MMLRWNVQSPELFIARASETLPFWVSLVLVIALGYYAARLVWLLVPLPAQPEWTPPPFAGIPAGAGQSAGDQTAYAAITNAHLFGQPSAAEPSAADAQNAPETQLNLQLRGAIAAADERYAHAIIADASGIEKVYFLKDTVPGGAVLQRVQPDRVILSRGGVLEALLLPKESTGGDQTTARGNAQIQPLARRNRGPNPSMQEVVTQNANSITEVIRPQPFMPNGELKGYRIYPGRNRDQFVALGLQAGDLVTEINGMTLNNPAQAMELFRSLADTTQVTVTIEREGQAQTLTLDTTQVTAAASGATPGVAPGTAPAAALATPAAAPTPTAVPAGSVPPGGASQ